MKPEERAEYLKPFTLTSILKEEMMNLREENEGVKILICGNPNCEGKMINKLNHFCYFHR